MTEENKNKEAKTKTEVLPKHPFWKPFIEYYWRQLIGAVCILASSFIPFYFWGWNGAFVGFFCGVCITPPIFMVCILIQESWSSFKYYRETGHK